jgi:hypothetical protein
MGVVAYAWVWSSDLAPREDGWGGCRTSSEKRLRLDITLDNARYGANLI